ncbi:hypothetical protein FD37_GL000919 [Levilactobacillus spicheri DSM 15429]|uniref:Uncharacterized protein n=1 Tax=Levilactobacillus spicheri DSM 15429 TaxID=1423805 RepID=A0A0R1QXJ4_9LACO|nr:hypothetical protein FD37_GL000919 [Levilactobacillus spicheri DSM 15429]
MVFSVHLNVQLKFYNLPFNELMGSFILMSCAMLSNKQQILANFLANRFVEWSYDIMIM